VANFPNMTDGLSEWLNAITFQLSTKAIVNFQAQETKTVVKFQGILYSQTPQQLMAKPEGQRNWNWWSLITSYNLNIGDIVLDRNNTEYRVIKKNDFSSGQFYEYEISQNWTEV
jgi:hypothetical protein